MQKKMHFDAEKAPEADQYTISYLTACLLHDILPGMVHCHIPTIQKFWDLKFDLKLENAKFTGYWENGGYSNDTLKISRYDFAGDMPYGHVLIVGNTGRTPVDFPKDYSPDFLQEKHRVKDLWNDTPVEELKSLTVKPGSFLLLGVGKETR